MLGDVPETVSSDAPLPRSSPCLCKPHADQLFDERLRQRFVDREVKCALCHRVRTELVSQLRQDRAAEREITQVVTKGSESSNRLPAQPEGRHTVGDDLLGLGDDLEDGAAERFERSPLRLLETSQILIDIASSHVGDSRGSPTTPSTDVAVRGTSSPAVCLPPTRSRRA